MGSIVDTLVQGSGDIDVYVISGERERARGRRRLAPWQAADGLGAATSRRWPRSRPRHRVAWAAVPVLRELSNLVMVYLLGVIIVATRYGRGPPCSPRS